MNVVSGEAQHISVSPKQSTQHLDYKLVGIVKYFLHIPSNRNGNSRSVGEDHGPVSAAPCALPNHNALITKAKGAFVSFKPLAFRHKKRGVPAPTFRSLHSLWLAVLSSEAEDTLLAAAHGTPRHDDPAKAALAGTAVVFDGQFEGNQVTLAAPHHSEDVRVIWITVSCDLCPSVSLQVSEFGFGDQAVPPGRRRPPALPFYLPPILKDLPMSTGGFDGCLLRIGKWRALTCRRRPFYRIHSYVATERGLRGPARICWRARSRANSEARASPMALIVTPAVLGKRSTYFAAV
jgi:hypothetical protein